MLLILILLLKFTDFELSGQNIETQAISAKFKNWIFDTYLNIIVTMHLKRMYFDICKTNQFILKTLPQDKYFLNA